MDTPQQLTLLDNFKNKENGLHHLSETKNGEIEETRVTSFPIHLDSVQKGEAQGAFSYVLKQRFPIEGWIDIPIGADKLTAQGGMAELAGKGVIVHDPKLFQMFARESATMFHTAQKMDERYDSFGWKNNSTEFLYGKRLYDGSGIRDVTGSPEIETRSQWLVPARMGKLDDWSQAASALFAAGCEPQSFALLCGFAAPLMRFHSSHEGGAIVSLVSRGSGTGKTTALTAIASIWGEDRGLALTNIDTKVSKGLTLGALGNLPVIFDELDAHDPVLLREFVVMFTNGRDKMRADQGGQKIHHTQSSWQTILVAACNRSLVDTLDAQGDTEAPGLRILEFEATLPKEIKHVHGDKLKRALEASAGHAGDAYLRYLVNPEVMSFMRRAIPQWTEEIWHNTKLSSEHRFWVRTLGAVAAASHVVRRLDLLAFDPQRIIEWACNDLQRRATERAYVKLTGHMDINVTLLGQFLNEHVPETIVCNIWPAQRNRNEQVSVLREPRARLVARIETVGQRVLIDVMALRIWLVKHGMAVHYFVGGLRTAGIVTAQKPMNLGLGTKWSSAPVPCIEIDTSSSVMSGIAKEAVVADQNILPMRKR